MDAGSGGDDGFATLSGGQGARDFRPALAVVGRAARRHAVVGSGGNSRRVGSRFNLAARYAERFEFASRAGAQRGAFGNGGNGASLVRGGFVSAVGEREIAASGFRRGGRDAGRFRARHALGADSRRARDSALAQRLGGIEGALAADNLRRALNRSSLVVAALLVSLSLVIGMNVMVRSFRDTVASWVSGSISADLFIATSSGFDGQRGPGIPREVIDFATRNPNVATFDTLRQAQLEIGGQNVILLANELPSIESGQRQLRFISRTKSALTDFYNGDAVLLSERLASLLDKGVSDTLTIPTPSGLKTLPIGGVFYDYNPNAVFYLDRRTYQKWWRDNQIDGLALYLKGSDKAARAEAIKREIDRKFGAQYALRLLPNAAIRREVFDTFDQTFAVTYALQLIALVVAAFGVFDTLVAMILERTTEFASLRAMGASAAQIRKLAFWEFGMLAFFAWIMGSLAGVLLASEMIFVINRQFFGWTIFPTFQPQVLLQAALLAFGAIAFAGWFPARQAARRDLAGALQRE